MTQESSTIPKFFFCAEAATELRRSEASIRWLWQTGALRSRVVGGRRVSTAQDLADFFEAATR